MLTIVQASQRSKGSRALRQAIGFLAAFLLMALPAQGSPMRPARAAWRASWNLRHNAAWTARPRVSPRVRSSAQTTYEAHGARAARAVLDPHSLWNRYFARALATHQREVRGPHAVGVLAVAEASTGRLPQTPLVRYLTWRRGLNPARFDYYHPRLGPILQGQMLAPPPKVGGIKIEPPPPVIPPSNPPENPPQVPEPSSLAVAVVLLGAGLWARHRRRTG